jgi:shikimate dehydrogenase
MSSEFITVEQLADWGRTGSSFDPPARLAVIGDPVGHSRSPQMHNAALLALGMPMQYIRVQVPPGGVGRAFGLFREAGFLGVNVTIPHKLEALEAVDHVDPAARVLGVVNTVAIRENGLFGYNTDGPGFVRVVREAFQADLRDLRILILGAAGGAGRAVAIQCALQGCWKLVLVNRTLEKARQLLKDLQNIPSPPNPVRDMVALPWQETLLQSELENVDLIVNATSLGMNHGDGTVVPPGSLRPHHMVLDMVYRSSGATPLIAKARQAGAKTADGLSLLLHQGALSFEHWFEREAPLDVMRRGLA